MPYHPALAAGRTAVITGAASGIGLAAAERFADFGMKVCMADANVGALERRPRRVSRARWPAGRRDRRADRCLQPRGGRAAEGARLRSVRRGRVPDEQCRARRDPARHCSAIRSAGRRSSTPISGASSTACRFLAPAMIAQKTPGAIVNTGSKQGITCPPGNTAYNVSKAGVKVVTEALAHELRNIDGCQVTAHLLIPGFTFTGHHRPRRGPRSRPAPGPAEQVIDFMLREPGEGRLLHPLPGQRGDAADGREADALGDGRYRAEPPRALALASGLQGCLREVHGRVSASGNAIERGCDQAPSLP